MVHLFMRYKFSQIFGIMHYIHYNTDVDPRSCRPLTKFLMGSRPAPHIPVTFFVTDAHTIAD